MFNFKKKGCYMKLKVLCSMLCFAFLNSAQLRATEEQQVQIHLSIAEVEEIFNNPNRLYVYLGEEVSVIPQVIAEVSKLEDNQDSLVRALADHLKRGFVIGYYETVLQSLEQAQLVLRNHADALDKKRAFALFEALNEIITHVTAHNLSLNAERLAFLKDPVIPENNDNSKKEVPTEVQ